jgi:lipocalin-like protein
MDGLGRKFNFGWLAAGAMLSALVSLPGISYAQSLKEQIVGTWRLASIYNEENGVKHFNFGDKPVGMLMFDRSGNVVQFLSKSDVPKFAVANRLKGTDAENRVAMQSIIAGFGSYAVDGDTVTISWLASSYPNRAGTQEKRTYKITGDNMVGTNPVASSGGTSYSHYTRAK